MNGICENGRSIRRFRSEELIVQDTSSWRPKTITVSPNGKRLAYLIKKKRKGDRKFMLKRKAVSFSAPIVSRLLLAPA